MIINSIRKIAHKNIKKAQQVANHQLFAVLSECITDAVPLLYGFL